MERSRAPAPAAADTRTEVLAGITTFLATMYIIVVNPSILTSTGMPFSGVVTATVLASAFASIAMGLYARNPIVLAPGMGINAFFAYTVVGALGVPWETALGAVFWSGVLFLVLSVLNVRTAIVRAIPKQLRYGVAAGIGLFITMIGLTNAGFLVASDATLIRRGPLDAVTLTFLIGLLVTALFVARRTPGALILGIAFTTLLSVPIGRWWGDASTVNQGIPTLVTWQGVGRRPDVSLLLSIDFLGSLKLAMFPVVFTFLFTDMFDTIATFMGIAEAGNLKDESGDPRHIRESMIVDSLATVASGIVGTSPTTSYIESAAGIEQGGRTGLVAIVAGLLFLPFMFLSPLLSTVPGVGTAPALVLVGVFMMRPVLRIHWECIDDAIPAFLGLILIPLTHSITQGIIWAFLSWTVLKLLVGKREEVSLTLILIDVFAVLALTLEA